MQEPSSPPGYAFDCRYLRRTIVPGRSENPVACLCTHPIRADFDCVGPFLEELPTDCRLWEPITRPARAGATG